MIELAKLRSDIYRCALKAFEDITGLSGDIRKDEKKRTGIQVFVRVPNTDNFVYFSVNEPPELSKVLAVEKADRAWLMSDCSSQNSENPDEMRFRGCLMAQFMGDYCQASISGLKGDEDVAIAVKILSLLSKAPPNIVRISILNSGGKLPKCFGDKDHYLYKFLELG